MVDCLTSEFVGTNAPFEEDEDEVSSNRVLFKSKCENFGVTLGLEKTMRSSLGHGLLLVGDKGDKVPAVGCGFSSCDVEPDAAVGTSFLFSCTDVELFRTRYGKLRFRLNPLSGGGFIDTGGALSITPGCELPVTPKQVELVDTALENGLGRGVMLSLLSPTISKK